MYIMMNSQVTIKPGFQCTDEDSYAFEKNFDTHIRIHFSKLNIKVDMKDLEWPKEEIAAWDNEISQLWESVKASNDDLSLVTPQKKPLLRRSMTQDFKSF